MTTNTNGTDSFLSETFEDLLAGTDDFLLWVNQAWREAWVLARLDGKLLVEYTMPRGSTAMRLVFQDNLGRLCLRNVSYKTIPLRWLKEMVDTGITWEGRPQQTRKAMPSVKECYTQRYLTLTRMPPLTPRQQPG